MYLPAPVAQNGSIGCHVLLQLGMRSGDSLLNVGRAAAAKVQQPPLRIAKDIKW